MKTITSLGYLFTLLLFINYISTESITQLNKCDAYWSPNLAKNGTIKHSSSCFTYGTHLEFSKNMSERKPEGGRPQRVRFSIDETINVYEDTADSSKDKVVVLFQSYRATPLDERLDQQMVIDNIHEHIAFFQVKFQIQNSWNENDPNAHQIVELAHSPSADSIDTYTCDKEFRYGFLSSIKNSFGGLNASLATDRTNITDWGMTSDVSSPNSTFTIYQDKPWNGIHDNPMNQKDWFKKRGIKSGFVGWWPFSKMHGVAIPNTSKYAVTGSVITILSVPSSFDVLTLKTKITHTIADVVYGSHYMSHNPYTTWDYGAIQTTTISPNGTISPSVEYYRDSRVSKFN